jgi:MFS family permease
MPEPLAGGPVRKPQSAHTVSEVRLRRVLPLYLVVFVGFVGYSLMIAIFTPLVLRVDGGMLPHDTSAAGRTIALGVLLALYPLAQFLGAPVIGGVADVAPVQQRSRLFGYVYLSSSLAYVVGPLAGGKLADRHLVSWFDYATPFWAASGLLVAVLAFTALAFTETSAQPRRDEPISVTGAFTSLADAARPGRMRRLFLTNFVLYLSIFGFFRVYPMYLINRFDMTVARESLFVAWVAVPIVVANLGLVGWLARRMTARQMARRCSIVLGVAMATIVIPDR